jgi:hypothetical protein
MSALQQWPARAMVRSSQDIITVPSKRAGCNCLAVLLIVGFLKQEQFLV